LEWLLADSRNHRKAAPKEGGHFENGGQEFWKKRRQNHKQFSQQSSLQLSGELLKGFRIRLCASPDET